MKKQVKPKVHLVTHLESLEKCVGELRNSSNVYDFMKAVQDTFVHVLAILKPKPHVAPKKVKKVKKPVSKKPVSKPKKAVKKPKR